jgi:hypothetical protein
VFPEVVCLVTDGELTISVAGESGVWFKADDFRLALVSPENLILDETDDVVPEINGVVYPKVTVKRTIKPETWSTFVVPFDIPKSMLSGWEVKELSESKQDGDHLNVWFKDCEDGIKAGVPYMVRNAVMEDDLTEIVMENVKVNTLVLNNKKTDGVTFVGQYVKTNIPVGDFFISGNTFYQAAHDRNTMKGFRARLVPDVAAGVKSVGIAMDGSESTSVDNIESAKAVVESVYGADGIPRPCIQIGLNIVKMSDGTVKKVYMRQ